MSGPMERMREAFIGEVLAGMRRGEPIMFLSADFGSPSLEELWKEFPDRFINVGIAEQNLVNVAAGFALEGFKVIAYAIAPFISMRCYEQNRVNLAMLSQFRDINVTLLGVGAGMSYDVSGPSHQALEDLTVMRALPNFEVYSPADAPSAAAIARECLAGRGPKYVRLDSKPLPRVYGDISAVPMKKGFKVVKGGSDACLVSTGYMTHVAVAAAEILEKRGLSAAVVDVFKLGSRDNASLAKSLAKFRRVVSVEEAFVGCGGLDAMIRMLLGERRIDARFMGIGHPLKYHFAVGTREQLLKDLHLDPAGIAARVARFCAS